MIGTSIEHELRDEFETTASLAGVALAALVSSTIAAFYWGNLTYLLTPLLISAKPTDCQRIRPFALVKPIPIKDFL